MHQYYLFDLVDMVCSNKYINVGMKTKFSF